MESCRAVFLNALQLKPHDPFLYSVIFMLSENPTVKQFYNACHAEIKLYCGSEAELPYVFQSRWIANQPLAKSIVAWILNGRQGTPLKLREMMKTTVPKMIVNNNINHTILSVAWLMLEQCLGIRLMVENMMTKKEIDQREKKVSFEFYPAQLQTANEIFAAIRETRAYESYNDDVDFRIIGPPNKQLQQQTRERVINLIWETLMLKNAEREKLKRLVSKTHENGTSITDKESRFDAENLLWMYIDQLEAEIARKVISVRMFSQGLASRKYYELCKAVLENDKRLMFVVIDECHLGCGKGSQLDILLNGALHESSGKDPNWVNILRRPNVVILSVSSTPWNNLVVPFYKEIKWQDAEQDHSYTSWESYVNGRNQDKVTVSREYEARLKYWSSLGCWTSDIKRALPTICLMVDYALGFLNCGATQETKEVIQHMNSQERDDDDDVVLIRVQKGGLQEVFCYWMKMFTSGGYNVVCPVLSEMSFEASLKGKTLLVVCEKGRCGDTIPNLSIMDLRTRYRKTGSHQFSSFFQDVGRCMGYRKEAPRIILGEGGYDLMKGNTRLVDRFLKPLVTGNVKDMICGGNYEKFVAAHDSMWTDITAIDHIKQNQLLLMAKPQCGKTGCFIRVIELLLKEILGR